MRGHGERCRSEHKAGTAAAFFPDWQEPAGGARPYISMTVSAIIPD